jgi:hypothetical protein
VELLETVRQGRERVLILVKALPHDSRIGETVCCAAVTEDLQWRRQFPIRFRHLKDKKFQRWQWIDYSWRRPSDDRRTESRRVDEGSIVPGKTLPHAKRAPFLSPMIVEGTKQAASRGQSLALVRPEEIEFLCRRKDATQVAAERRSFAHAAAQHSLFDEELDALDPCPYEFRFRYRSADGRHDNACADWETAVTYWRLEKTHGEIEAIRRMKQLFGVEYPQKGVAFALGTHSRHPDTWLLIGVLRLDVSHQMSLL